MTKNVVAGELLLCEKAFAYCAATSSKTSMLMNTHTNRITLGTQADLVTALAQKMFRNRSLMSSFTSLYHSDYQPKDEAEVDDIPVVDRYKAHLTSHRP